VGAVRWWYALSRLDNAVHLLAPERPHGALAARCGHALPAAARAHDQPPPGPPCESCRLILLADATRPGRSPVEHVPLSVPGDRPVPPTDNDG
jgi:hypothetical protein